MVCEESVNPERTKVSIPSQQKKQHLPEFLPYDKKHYTDYKRKNIIRLSITYLAPLILLTIYFCFQYNSIVSESQRLHLKSIAENQANTLDLFLSERVVNLANLINDPKFQSPPAAITMQSYLEKLIKNSEAFVDIGYFDSAGVQTDYTGPYPFLEKRNYSSETWYMTLKDKKDNFIITDIYMGFRQKPHFTLAVSRIINNQFIVLRATLDPEKIYEYISSLEGSSEVSTSIVNKEGYYQLVTPPIGTPLEASSIVPPDKARLGADKVKIKGTSFTYAYSWLRKADWALIVQWSHNKDQGIFSGFHLKIIGISTLIIIMSLFMIFNRAQKLVEFQIESDRTRVQLEHAAKLASVGELASGIAHEINNPLAIINEEAGLIKDIMNPEYGEQLSTEELYSHLDTIQESVFRCRDITRKLLGFVRKTDTDLEPHDINQLIDGVVDGLLGQEIAVSNIDVSRNYSQDLPHLVTDKNQLQQVLLNLLNNSIDAFEDHPGKIAITTSRVKNNIRIDISDNGKGIAPDQIDRLFVPFYTTKEVGKGTGLGLSVSYGIIKNLGGKISVESRLGEGSIFTIILPIRK